MAQDHGWTAETLKASLCRQLRSEHFFAVCEATLGLGRVDVLALRVNGLADIKAECERLEDRRAELLEATQELQKELWERGRARYPHRQVPA